MAAPSGGPTPRPIKTSQLKSRILNVAKPNLFVVKFRPPQTVVDFLKSEGRDINYDVIGEDIELRCYQTTTPSSSFMTHATSADYHGVVEEIPYRRSYENEIALSFYVDNNYDIVEFFEGWMDYMSGVGTGNRTRDSYYAPYVNYRMNYYNDYTNDIYITKFEKDIIESDSEVEDEYSKRIKDSRQKKYSMEYVLIKAYPKRVDSMSFSYSSNSESLTLDVSFGYSRYVRQRKLIR
jgi:hypothetical protein